MKKSDIQVGGLYATGSSRMYGQDMRQQALVLATDYTSNGDEPFEGKTWQRNDSCLVLRRDFRYAHSNSPEPVDLAVAREHMTEKLYLDRKEATKHLGRFADRDALKKALAPFPQDSPGWRLIIIPNKDILMGWDEYLADRTERAEWRAKQEAERAEKEEKRRKEAALISDELESFGLPRLSGGASDVRLTFEQYHQLVDRTGRDG